MKVLQSGEGEFIMPDLDGVRAWMRDRKPRGLVSKLMSEHEAVERFVSDGDYLCYDLTDQVRGPESLLREIVRQRKRHLWLCAKYTYFASTMLVAAGCADKCDVGFIGMGNSLSKAVAEGKCRTIEYTNGIITLRLLAGAMNVPFLPTRTALATDTIKYSGCKVVEDPYTGRPLVLVPALNPDVSLIHVNQADMYGNARVLGPSVAPMEAAMASKKVIISTEEIIDSEEIRRDPAKTTIPYYFVDGVVHAPFGAHPGTVTGLYRVDAEGMLEMLTASNNHKMDEYLEKYVYSVGSHEEYLEKRVGLKRLLALQAAEKIREGYYQ